MKPEQAFDQHHQAVFSYVYRLTGRTDLAEDVTQECFLALIRTPQRFDAARGTVKTYLFAIARNLVLKSYRDNREDPTEIDAATMSTDPTATIEIGAAVERAMAALPHLQREALVLFDYEGLTLEEVARTVGVDAGTVKSRLHRARERLRRDLAPYRNVRGTHGTA